MMTNPLLNPKFFNQTSQTFIYRNNFLQLLQSIFKKHEKEWVINYDEDISAIFIVGENIQGKYTPQTPLIINLYLERIKIEDVLIQKIIRQLQAEMRKDQKYANFNLILRIDQSPLEFYLYFDIFQNQLIYNKEEYRKNILTKDMINPRILNPQFFNQTSQTFIYQNDLLRLLQAIMEENENEWVIGYEDISAIFIVGENIQGKYTPQTPLIINLYFEGILISDLVFQKIIRLLQAEIRKDQKYMHFNLILQVDKSPLEFYPYFDVIQNRLIYNKEEYRKKILKPTKIIYMEKPQEAREFSEILEERKKRNISSVERQGEQLEIAEEMEAKTEIIPRTIKTKIIENQLLPKSRDFEEFVNNVIQESKKIYEYTKDILHNANQQLERFLTSRSRKELKDASPNLKIVKDLSKKYDAICEELFNFPKKLQELNINSIPPIHPTKKEDRKLSLNEVKSEVYK